MSGTIKNVAIAGAAGTVGKVVLPKLIAAGYNVKVLRRDGSKSTFEPEVQVVDVDYDSVDSLKAALDGQDALVATLGAQGLDVQYKLVDAAIAAGVQRFLPSEFGSNGDNAFTRKNPVLVGKVKVQDYIIEKAKGTSLTYSFLYTGAFLDWGLHGNFLLDTSKYEPSILDGGDTTFSSTSLDTIGDAVVGVLAHPAETKDRSVFIEDIKLTQNQLLRLAKKAAPEKPWAPKDVKIDDLLAVANQELAKGNFDLHLVVIPLLQQGLFTAKFGNNFEKTDNALLGLKGKTEDDVEAIFKEILQ